LFCFDHTVAWDSSRTGPANIPHATVGSLLKGRDTPDAIRQRGAIFSQFLKINKRANERKFLKDMLTKELKML
jgi:hypothetical protein